MGNVTRVLNKLEKFLLTVSYKEESDEEETDEDDLIEVSADAVVDYEDDDRETIEKVFMSNLIYSTLFHFHFVHFQIERDA